MPESKATMNSRKLIQLSILLDDHIIREKIQMRLHELAEADMEMEKEGQTNLLNTDWIDLLLDF